MSINTDAIIKEFAAVKTRRAPWELVWDLVCKYVLMRKRGFTKATADGTFYMYGDVYDDTAIKSNNQMVSSLAGALWKNGARTFRIVKPRSVADSEAVKVFYKEANERTVRQMEHPKAGFSTSFSEYLLEQGSLGTSGFGTFKAKDGSDHILEYKACGLRGLYVVEDANGQVSKNFFEVELNAFQVVEEYGEVGKTANVKSAIDSQNRDTKFKVLWVIQPRLDYDAKIKNNLNMPYESVHILEEENVQLRESGFRELPIKVTRFYKNDGEEYGRSPGMESLPSNIELNAIWEIITKGGELDMDPSLYLLDDGSFGGVLDRSPGALNVLDISSRISNTSPIGIVGPPGDPSKLLKLLEVLTNQIVSHFFVDRLLDLNNKTRMTLGEAQIRNEMRAESLGSVYMRQIDECLTPTIKRSIGILVEVGEFGTIQGSEEGIALTAAGKTPVYLPQELVDAQARGEEIYNIEYISPAARILQSEEVRGIMSTWQFAGTFAAVAPEFMIRLNKKWSLERVAELTGATRDVLLSDDEFDKEWKAYQEAQQQAAQLQMQRMSAEIAAKQGSAAQQNAQAVATQAGGGGGGAPGGMGTGGMLL